MDAALTNDKSYCGNCGSVVAARFCTACGTDSIPSADANQPSGWWAVLEDFIGRDRNGLLRVALRMLRAPVSTGLQLARDAQYTGHLKFLTITTGAFLTLQYIALPKVLELLPDMPATKDSAAALYAITQASLYPTLLLMIFIQYYMFGALNKARRTLLEYYKLCVISVGYSSVLSIVLLLPAVILAYVLATASKF